MMQPYFLYQLKLCHEDNLEKEKLNFVTAVNIKMSKQNPLLYCSVCDSFSKPHNGVVPILLLISGTRGDSTALA